MAFVLLASGCRDSGEDADDVGSESTGADAGSQSGQTGSDGPAASSDDGGDGDDGDDSSGGTVEGPIDDRDCEPGHGLSATNFGMPFMLTWCAGCHSADLPADERAGAPVGIDLDTLEGVQQQLVRVYARTVVDGATMPPAGGPTLGERTMLGDWLACGAPE